jgi:sugar lactone lactonase YvrE
MIANRNRAVAGLALLAASVACNPQESPPSETTPVATTSDELKYQNVPTTLATYAVDAEGLTVDPDTRTLYTVQAPDATGNCAILKVGMDGSVATIGNLLKPAGLACRPTGLAFRNGKLYACDSQDNIAPLEGYVIEIDPTTGAQSVFASKVPGANMLTFDSAGNLWVTDGLRGHGRVYKRDAATGATAEQFRIPPIANGTLYGGLVTLNENAGIGRQPRNFPPGNVNNTNTTVPPAQVSATANGIVVREHGNLATLYIADTARGAIWRVRLDESRNVASPQGCDTSLRPDTVCESEIWAIHPSMEGADGLWADSDGSFWVGANSRNGIAHVDLWGRVKEHYRTPLNSQMLRSSADNAADNKHILEFPTNIVVVPPAGPGSKRSLCVVQTDRPVRDNWPAVGVGEIGGPGQGKGKISCFATAASGHHSW